MIHILFFGKLADIAERSLGSSETNYELTGDQSNIRLTDLRDSFTGSTPALAEELNKSSNLCAINQEMCTHLVDTIINDGDEVAFMSPLSGG